MLSDDENVRKKQLKQIKRRRSGNVCKDAGARKLYALSLRNSSSVWVDNKKQLAEFFKESKDMNHAKHAFFEKKYNDDVLSRKGRPGVSWEYVEDLAKELQKDLAVYGRPEEILRQTLDDFEMLRDIAIELALETRNIKPLLELIDKRNTQLGVKTFAQNIHIDNSKKELTINQKDGIKIAGKRLGDYLKCLPAEKRELLRMVAMEMRSEGPLPQLVVGEPVAEPPVETQKFINIEIVENE